jgi:hypothetical protein
MGMLLVLTSAGAVQADDAGAAPQDVAGSDAAIHPFFRHRLMLQGGAAFSSVDSFAQVGSHAGGFGTHLSLEKDLGLASDHTSFDTTVRLRLFERWMLEGAYFNVPRKRSVHAAGEIKFGDHTFDANATLKGDIDIASYRLALGYAFYKDARTEIGAALSLYVSDFSAALSGDASVNGTHVGFSTGTYEAPAPLPAIGIYGHYALSPRWLISGRADYLDFDISTSKWFGAELEDVGGYILSLEASTEYRVLDNVGVGIGYRYMDVELDATSSGMRGKAGYSFSAPTAFMRVDF